VREGVFTICLAHHPHAFDVARDRGIGLTLAGHTHGGQLMLPGDIGFGPLMYRYWSGLYTEGGAAAVINNGTGNWFPLRTFAPAEVGVLTLRRARVA
jgi:predicted MPP superfamily phosphohydrolase